MRDATASFFFFFNDTATTEIYTLSLHDALPISAHLRAAGVRRRRGWSGRRSCATSGGRRDERGARTDRKSTRLNSSHSQISYAVFCLKKKKTPITVYQSLPHHTRPVILPNTYSY